MTKACDSSADVWMCVCVLEGERERKVNLLFFNYTKKASYKKTCNFFLSFDFKFEISTKNSFRNSLHPDAVFSKIFSYGMAALWGVGYTRAKIQILKW